MTLPSGPTRRPSRRAIRPGGTVGTDDTVLVSTHPAPPAPESVPEESVLDQSVPDQSVPDQFVPDESGRDAGTAAQREPAIPVRSADDSDVGWGEAPDANDDRLRRDKPPHW